MHKSFTRKQIDFVFKGMVISAKPKKVHILERGVEKDADKRDRQEKEHLINLRLNTVGEPRHHDGDSEANNLIVGRFQEPDMLSRALVILLENL